MRTLGLAVVAALAWTAATPAPAKEPCPAVRTPVPWAINGFMSGDRYAEIYLDIDEHGKPTGCRMGQNNILGDDKFWICKAFMDQWSMQQPVGTGKTSATTVMRRYIEYGMKHDDAENAARSKYFREHPSERPECYPNEN